jgi:hypothetical protein
MCMADGVGSRDLFRFVDVVTTRFREPFSNWFKTPDPFFALLLFFAVDA